MAFVAKCDMCKKNILELDKLQQLDKELQIENVATVVCEKCARVVQRALLSHARYYHGQLIADVRELIYESAAL